MHGGWSNREIRSDRCKDSFIQRSPTFFINRQVCSCLGVEVPIYGWSIDVVETLKLKLVSVMIISNNHALIGCSTNCIFT